MCQLQANCSAVLRIHFIKPTETSVVSWIFPDWTIAGAALTLPSFFFERKTIIFLEVPFPYHQFTCRCDNRPRGPSLPPSWAHDQAELCGPRTLAGLLASRTIATARAWPDGCEPSQIRLEDTPSLRQVTSQLGSHWNNVLMMLLSSCNPCGVAISSC